VLNGLRLSFGAAETSPKAPLPVEIQARAFIISPPGLMGDTLYQITGRHRVQPLPERKPSWLKVRAPGGPKYLELKQLMRDLDLHTVCEEAHCPNVGECWEHGTATFMILGDICTRACGFCAVPSGKPVGPPDREEPFRVAEAVARMGLRYAVVTSVNRDDQADGGSEIFASLTRRRM